MACRLPGFSVYGILQGGILEWVAMLQGIFPTQDLTRISSVSRIDRRVLLPLVPPEKPEQEVTSHQVMSDTSEWWNHGLSFSSQYLSISPPVFLKTDNYYFYSQNF